MSVTAAAWAHSPADRPFIDASLRALPGQWWRHVARRYSDAYRDAGRAAANMALLAVRDTVAGVSIALATDDNAIRDEAAKAARRCKGTAVKDPKARPTLDRAQAERLPWMRDYVRGLGLELAEAETEAGEIARYECPHWWRRRLRAKHGRDIEAAAIAAGIVHRRADCYTSQTTVDWRRTQQTRNRAMLEELEAVNELGQAYTMAELVALSVANPKLRRAELMTRIKGFEDVAKAAGHVGEFYTLTCPSKFHPAPGKDGAHNPKYDGSTPREAQAYLCKVWARIRAALHRREIPIYGFRVAEPHHDGCPHWHLLLFMAPQHREAVREIAQAHALKVDGDETGAAKYRFKAVGIDPRKGTAAGYIAKYIAKAIDGFAIDQDLFGNDGEAAAERVNAWAARWGIRQFQQIGGPSVTVWRELRRIEGEEVGTLEAARDAADRGSWGDYVQAMGGPVLARDARPIRPLVLQMIDTRTGVIPSNRYGELDPGRVVGLDVGGVFHLTRWHEWTIGKKGQAALSEVAEPVGGFDLPWTRVNNCTEWGEYERDAGGSGAVHPVGHGAEGGYREGGGNAAFVAGDQRGTDYPEYWGHVAGDGDGAGPLEAGEWAEYARGCH